MDEHTLEILEFNKIRSRLEALASTDLGKRLTTEVRPGEDLDSVRYELLETSEMRALWEVNREPPLDGVKDLSEPVRRSRVPGALLLPEELLDIASTLEAVERVQKSLREARDRAEHVSHYGARLVPQPDLATRIHTIIDEFGQVRDGASPQLNRLRRDTRELRAGIVRRLEKLLRGAFKEYVVEQLYTLREDRYVLPVDTRYKNKVNGILHDRSASGSTVYIEPMAIVQDGNRLKDLRREDEIEARRILREVTEQVGVAADDLDSNQEIFAQIDFLGAKARFSILQKMSAPKLERGGQMKLLDARHPLLISHLGLEESVPLNLELDPEARGLVLSGPNAGGKTVVLKSIGLLCLMAQSGLHIPVKEGTVLPWFDDIGADIGDEQSLEQNLSTFSAHMTRIRDLLQRSKRGTLVLLDELGSGTDPAEGGALATAILEALVESEARFVATTHLDAVKVFAHGCPNTENAAMDFNEETLNPTYLCTLGLPGHSNAVQIARRLGLPALVVERARLYTEDEATRPEELLNQLSREIQETENQRAMAVAEHAKSARLREECKRQLQKAQNQARDTIERAQRKAQGLMQELDRRLDSLEDEERAFRATWKERLDELAAESLKQPEPQSALTTMRKGLDKVRDALEEEPEEPETPQASGTDVPPEKLQPGVMVHVMGMTSPGEVKSYNRNRDEIEISVNGLSVRVGRKRVDRIVPQKKKKKEDTAAQVSYGSGTDVPMSIDIHGMTMEDSEPIVQRYLDQAFTAGHPYATVCHGGGFGVLRKMVRSMAPKLSYVLSFRNGTDYEGGNGVTVINFREDV